MHQSYVFVISQTDAYTKAENLLNTSPFSFTVSTVLNFKW